MLDQILGLLSDSGLVLWGPFALLILCGLGLPLPEDIVLVSAGYLGFGAGYSLFHISSAMYVGILLGDSLVYFMGRRLGRRVLGTRFGRYVLSAPRLEKAESMFKKYGAGVVFVGRFLPGLRVPIFFSAGLLRFSVARFWLMDGFAALVSAPLFVALGMWGGSLNAEDFSHVEKVLGNTQMVILGGAAVLGVGTFLVIWKRSRSKSQQ